MNWLKLKLRNWVLSAQDEPEQLYSNSKVSHGMNTVSTRDVGSDPTLQFKVYNAIGGKVVEFSRYDRMKDRHFHDIYIIGKNEDFGEKIAKIAMLEALKD
jgi:hypothetical protein